MPVPARHTSRPSPREKDHVRRGADSTGAPPPTVSQSHPISCRIQHARNPRRGWDATRAAVRRLAGYISDVPHGRRDRTRAATSALAVRG